MTDKRYKNIRIRLETHRQLKSIGLMEDTFDDVISKLLSMHAKYAQPHTGKEA